VKSIPPVQSPRPELFELTEFRSGFERFNSEIEQFKSGFEQFDGANPAQKSSAAKDRRRQKKRGESTKVLEGERTGTRLTDSSGISRAGQG
jgi:hypothetical protein